MRRTCFRSCRTQPPKDRYVRFAEELLGLTLTDQQRDILRALQYEQRTVIQSGNGPGKSFGVAIGKLAFLVCNHNSTVLGTSGSYSQYVDAVWRPMKTLVSTLDQRLPIDIPTPTDGGQPTLELGADWFAKVVSPRDPGDLEGRHGEHVLVVIEEADKKYITDDHFDSAGSSITSDNDRMLAICNPPRDESNVVYEKRQSERWHSIQFSTLNAHNVRVDAGEIDAEPIPGVTDLGTIEEDWEAWNGQAWPGLDEARVVSNPESPQFRDDLDERWYRRRAGVMPPSRASAWRPIHKAHVEAAWERDHPPETLGDIGSGVDVARSGADFTIAATAGANALNVRFEEAGDDHTHQRDQLQNEYRDDPPHPIAVDAIGEGSGLADMLAELMDGVVRFGNGNEPTEPQTYYSCWEEALALLGDWLAAGGSINDRDLRDELLVAARMVTFEERHYGSRGGEVAKATASKDDIKQRMNRSPDRLDAALMAVWAKDADVQTDAAAATARVVPIVKTHLGALIASSRTKHGTDTARGGSRWPFPNIRRATGASCKRDRTPTDSPVRRWIRCPPGPFSPRTFIADCTTSANGNSLCAIFEMDRTPSTSIGRCPRASGKGWSKRGRKAPTSTRTSPSSTPTPCSGVTTSPTGTRWTPISCAGSCTIVTVLSTVLLSSTIPYL